jgi:phage terminase small subunit
MSVETLSDRQTKFAELVVAGVPAGRAYEQAGYTASGASADSAACKLLRIDKVHNHIQELRRKAAERSEMKRWEMIEWLTRVIRTGPGQVASTSDLAQEYQTDVLPEGSRTRVRMVPKMDAAKQLATLLGWTVPESDKPVQIVVKVGGREVG